jgi:copper chaperone
MAKTFKVSGMTCGGCVRSVEQAIKSAAPSASVSIDLPSGKVTVDGADEHVVAKAVDDAGFGFEGTV